MYWDSDRECMSRDELEELQLKRLKKTLKRASRAPFYQSKGIADISVKDLSDVRKLPFTVKEDLRDAYPYGMLSCPLDEVVRLHSSSGTTGTPTVLYHSAKDIDSWTELVARLPVHDRRPQERRVSRT
jgi:phenylacetate-CoA ligase